MKPRWARLYAVLPLALAALTAVELSAPQSALRTLLRYGIAVVAWGAIAAWVRANRVALHQVEWCDCAPRTVTVRVIVSRPGSGATLRM